MKDSLIKNLLMGFTLLVIGWLITFFMVIGVLETSFFLSFLGYGLSLAGLLTGVIGIILYKK